MNKHEFQGYFITDDEFASLTPRNVFHRQLESVDLPCNEHRNRHILFRKKLNIDSTDKAVMHITADDYYKLYINGQFVCSGPATAYPQKYGYNTVDVTEFLTLGTNTVAVHTLYQGLINRVFVSGDNRHGLLCDLVVGDKTVVCSDTSWLTHKHTGFEELDEVGYHTPFMEHYDSTAREVGFEAPNFDDSYWVSAKKAEFADYILEPQNTKSLVFERIAPASITKKCNEMLIDFGAMYVGYLEACAKGKNGDTITLRFSSELDENGKARYNLRANCKYEEKWTLSGKTDTLEQFDYKAFRYAEITLPPDVEITELYLLARHYPFKLKCGVNDIVFPDNKYKQILDLCLHTMKYGVQEVIQDCMEREKGFYVGDGCYTALTHAILTGDDSIVRKLIDDAFFSSFITDGLVTCLDCSHMQEIAEFPLMLISLVLWHYRIFGDKDYLKATYPKVTKLLDSYKREYEKENLLCMLDKWCVVEWPWGFRDGYDVDIREGIICREPHVALNAYYLNAIRTANEIAKIIGKNTYRDEKPVIESFYNAFYNESTNLFHDSTQSTHVSYIGNLYPYAFGLCPNDEYKENFINIVKERGIAKLSLFGSFPLLYGLVVDGKSDLAYSLIKEEGAWLRIIREGGTATFEGWGKDCKPNISLFHMTLSYVALFLTDTDIKSLFYLS